ncbi:MAG: hypothetical protein RL261_2033 [Pseudomonadota bacterium]|jgi:hypothetical protein
MTHRKDPAPTRVTPTLRVSHTETGKPTHPTSGRVAHDERGNAVWEMRTADHRYVRDGSTTLVRKLVPPLSIEATAILRRQPAAHAPKVPGPPLQKRAVPADGINPYGTGHMGTVKTFPVRTVGASKRAEPQWIAKSRAKPGLLDRLFRRKP